MAATLKTDRLQNKTDTTDNIILNSSGATTFGGAVTVTSGTINGTTIGASTATTGAFTNVTATNIQATGGQSLSLKEDHGTTVISVDTSGNVLLDPATSSGTISIGSANTQAVVQDAKVAGTGYESGLGPGNEGVGLGVGKMFAGITGEIKMYGGSSAPEGWVLCDGSRYDGSAGTAYKNLYDVLGTAYGDGDGTSNDFNVPDMRGRVPLGVGTGKGLNASNSSSGQDPATGSASTLTHRDRGAYGGREEYALSEANMPVHKHDATGSVSTQPVHGGTLPSFGVTGVSGFPGVAGFSNKSLIVAKDSPSDGGTWRIQVPQQNLSISRTTDVAISVSDSNKGSSNPITSQQKSMPFLCVNYIIKL